MLKIDNYISFFLSLLIAAGLTLSTVHFHYGDDSHADGIELQITQDSNDCAICASHFKVTSGSELDSEVYLHFNTSFFVHTEYTIVDPLNNTHDGRAPPFFG